MKLAAIALFSLLVLPQAPTYLVTKTSGDHDFLFSLRQVAKPVMSSTPDNTLSAWQPLPFAWKFFGDEVRGYRVSDNGYLTFDSTTKVTLASNTSLPNASAPRGTIMAYWSDLTMSGTSGPWSNTVVAGTFGTAPTRTHVIYWLSVPPARADRAGSVLSFAVAIHEGGDFEVIYTSARKSGALSGTVGAVSLDGTASVSAAGPAFDFPDVGFGGEDDQTFYFKRSDKE